MKKFLVFFSAFMILMSYPCFSQQKSSPPDGFRGINWGANIKDCPDLIEERKSDNLITYFRKNDPPGELISMGIHAINYVFYKGKFYFASRTIWGKSASNDLKETLILKYGKPSDINEDYNNYSWKWKEVEISFTYSSSPPGMLYYRYLPLLKELEKEKEEKAKSK